MYVTTFYSFKGGVGRSMALVNVAAHLAQQGRRVLAVDFDLEAPGLDTFDLPGPTGSTPGIVDFVSEYLTTGHAPAVERFVFESSGVGAKGGRLWIMPSGAQSESYASKFANIDWGDLYERHQGYLLFEDLKEQWKSTFNPDYVLVDSRTGHTDVGGICTRQLPDAVAILFFPNDQNRRGLSTVVQDIRSENKKPIKKKIQIHFIMSNVPDLDDEDRIIDESISSFERDLKFQDPLIIHRYDSLSLLSQVVFTKDRPRSRLAKEYRAIAAEIMQHNPHDRDGVLDYLDYLDPMLNLTRSRTKKWVRQLFEFDGALETYAGRHKTDGKVLFRLGTLRERFGRSGKAAELFDRAIDAGYRAPEVYLNRAQIRGHQLSDTEGAQEDAAIVIGSADASPEQVLQSIGILGAENLKDLDDLSGLLSMPPEDRVALAQVLSTTRAEAEAALVILRPLQDDTGFTDDEARLARNLLVLSYISCGKFTEAIDAIDTRRSSVNEMEVNEAFNYGMALWGKTGQIFREPFERVLECWLQSPLAEAPDANNLQCLAITHWVAGNQQDAERYAVNAMQEIQSKEGEEFSCWRYLRVSESDFKADVEEILKLIRGDMSVRPIFLSLESTEE